MGGRTRQSTRRVPSADEIWAAEISDRVLADCHPKQRAAVEDSHRRVALLVGRGGGKTTALRAKYVIDMAATIKGRYVYVAPTLGMATELMWDPLKDLCEKLQIEADFREIGKACTFRRTGARLRLIGGDDRREIDKLRGQAFDGVGVDETAVFPPQLIDILVYRVVGPRLGERDGWLRLASTPGHHLLGLFYDATRSGSDLHRPYVDRRLPEFKSWQKWSSHAWTLRDVAEMPNAKAYPALVANWKEALLEKATNGWGDDNPIWMREYLGLWAADDTENIYRYRAHLPNGEPWNQWDPPIDAKTGFAKLPTKPDSKESLFTDWHYGYGLDMGSKDPFALNIAAFSPSDTTRTLYHVYSFGKTAMYARTIAVVMLGEEAVTRILRGETIDYEQTGAGTFAVTGWPAAIVADLAALGEAVIDELANVYGIRIKAAEKKGKHATIEGTNGDLVDGRHKILKGSPLEQQLQQLQWRRDEYGQVKEGKGDRNDHSDSWIYLRRDIANLFAAGVVVAQKPEKPIYSDPMGLATEAEGEYDKLLSDGDFSDSDWGNNE